AYIMIPTDRDEGEVFSSLGHGGEIQFDIPLKKAGKPRTAFPTLGFGGGYAYSVTSNKTFSEYTADITTQRLMGHGTLGVRILTGFLGIEPRAGYGFTRTIYDFDNFSNCESCKEELTKDFHRLNYEFYLHVPFGMKKQNYGLLLGARFLHDFLNHDNENHLFLLKAGLTF
ncbi:MAG TPA: hypothetical protein VEA37_00720, partial [Flavobacterium sp.]|nr:hypothetical protein [Flavobacterium sp.]